MLLSLGVVLIALTAIAGGYGERLAATVRVQGRAVLSAQIVLEEAERSRANRQQWTDVQRVSEGAVHFGTNTVRAVHQGIAAIPFTVLEAIPVTRGPTRVVRAVHDAIAGGVYGTITGVNRLVGSNLRKPLQIPAPTPNDSKKESKP